MNSIRPIKTVFCAAPNLPIPFESVCRYLGLGNSKPDSQLAALVERSIGEFRTAARFAACYVVAPVMAADGGVNFGGLTAPGKSLAKHLAGCDQAILFAATAGMETERQRKRASVTSPVQALALDAVGTAAIESFCDWLCGKWAEEFPGSALRPRFSPGYGDLPLEMQKPLLALLEANRNAGISLTDALLMVPQKSVSAVVGIGKTGCTAKTPDCVACDKRDCEFRL